MKPKIHPTALIEDGVTIGAKSSVWDNVHIRGPQTCIGEECIVGEKSYIAYGVTIGDRVKINAFVYVCTAVTIEDGCMLSAGVTFTNDRFPRATTPDLRTLASSAPDEKTCPTRVCAGATIGARAVIGSNLQIGRFAMVGMGAVVTRTVKDFHLVLGNPARPVALVCRCGVPFHYFEAYPGPAFEKACCPECSAEYGWVAQQVIERADPSDQQDQQVP